MSEELKPCPFCGEEPSCYETFFIPRMSNIPDVITICCGDCGIEIQRESLEEAIQAWNRRANE